MPQVVPFVTAAAAVAGISAANEAGNQAEAAQRAQQPLLAAQARQADFQTEMSRFMFGRYQDDFVPLEDKWLELVKKGENPEEEAAAATADVRASFGRQGDIAERELQRRGIDPGDGRIASLITGGGLNEAKAVAGAGTTARRYAKERTYQMLSDATNVGRGAATAGANTAAQAASTYGSVAGAYGNRASEAYGRAADYGQAAGGALSDTLDWIDDWAKKKYTTQPSTVAPQSGPPW